MSYFLWFRDDRITHVIPEGSQGCAAQRCLLVMAGADTIKHSRARQLVLAYLLAHHKIKTLASSYELAFCFSVFGFHVRAL
jgi:hypothetical protein